MGVPLYNLLMTDSDRYRDSGVDIDRAEALVRRIKPLAKRTRQPGVLGDLGGFGGLFALPDGYQDAVLVGTTDGVGTKLLLANRAGAYHALGIDLVAMCVNDLVATGAKPLFFLDYLATGRLSLDTATAVIEGVADGCCQAGCALLGGETAEMPGLYLNPEDCDLAGFALGIAERAKLQDPAAVRPGDCLLGLASSGAHANGFSLIRKVLDEVGAALDQPFGEGSLGEALLAPTRIYVRPLLDLLAAGPVTAMCHVTGGGLVENLPRVLPPDTRARISRSAWQRPALFDWLAEHGRIGEAEMHRVFNCGIGFVVCVPSAARAESMALLEAAGERVFEIGEIISGDGPAAVDLVD